MNSVNFSDFDVSKGARQCAIAVHLFMNPIAGTGH